MLSSALTAGGVALTIAGGSPTVFAQMTKIGVAVAGGVRPLRLGESVTLIRNDAGLEGSGGTLQQGTDYQQVNLTGRQGISLDYGFALDNDANSIFAQVTAVPQPQPQPQSWFGFQPLVRLRQLVRLRLRMRMLLGVISTSSSTWMYSRASSRVNVVGGVSRIALSADAARVFVS